MHKLVDEAVANWLKDGTITRAPVNTSWNSPLTLADKKDAHGNKTGKRPCLDPRHINRLLPDDKYPLPLIREIFHSLKGSTVFTTLDLKSAFHRFQIHEEDQHKTTFTHNGLQYMFQGCPFGLKPLSAKFQRVMALLFQDTPFVQTFVDDIIIHSANMTEHLQHVQIAIQK
ncbi:MAG TPA: reverse transcriptase family protein, partial [Methylomirabilota bacterium]|nr:reverse transcriptase family protein [Methylomirabilota bacterium]